MLIRWLRTLNHLQTKNPVMQMQQLKRFELLVSVGCLLLLSYLGWQVFYGPRGLPYKATVMQHVTILTDERDIIETHRKALEARVALMRPESIDPDLLDELARKNLNMVRANDIIIEFNQSNP